jgi:hypothetical protein
MALNFFQNLASGPSQVQVPVHHKTEYHLAKIAYEKPAERASKLQQLGISGSLVEGSNKDEFYAFKHGDKLWNVHRGSVTKEDWMQTDSALAVGQLQDSDRYHRAVKDSAQAEQATGMKGVEVGHSLGGTLGETIAHTQGKESVVFNQGTSPLTDYSKFDRNKNVHYRVEGDSVSQFDSTAHKIVNQSSGFKNTELLQDIVLDSVPFGGLFGLLFREGAKVGMNHGLGNFRM